MIVKHEKIWLWAEGQIIWRNNEFYSNILNLKTCTKLHLVHVFLIMYISL